MNCILETERLTLREFTLADTRFILELLNSIGWLQYIGDRNVRTEEQAISYLADGPIKSYRENGYGLSMVETKQGIPIGMCGILKRDTLASPDVGFAFLPQYHGKGYAFEMVNAMLTYARATLEMQEVLAITLPNNLNSIKLLEKLGFMYVKAFCSPGSDEKLLLYRNQ